MKAGNQTREAHVKFWRRNAREPCAYKNKNKMKNNYFEFQYGTVRKVLCSILIGDWLRSY
jgi:hypothetical protein